LIEQAEQFWAKKFFFRNFAKLILSEMKLLTWKILAATAEI